MWLRNHPIEATVTEDYTKWMARTYGTRKQRGRDFHYEMDDAAKQRVINGKIDLLNAEEQRRKAQWEADNAQAQKRLDETYERELAQYEKDKAAYDAAKKRYLENMAENAAAEAAAQFAANSELEKNKSKSVATAMGKIFAPQVDIIRYSKTGDAADWYTEQDAGFLPSGRNVSGDVTVVCVAIHNNDLIAFFGDQVQVWAVDADPNNMRLKHTMHNIGCIDAGTVCNIGNDLYFLTKNGFRSLKMNEYGDTRNEYDIGSPVDDMVKKAIAANKSGHYAACYYSYIGAYICAIGTQLFVFTQNQSSRIAAWSIWTIAAPIQNFAAVGNDLYCLDVQNNLYKFTSEAASDGGENIEVTAQIPFMDFKSPGVLKMLVGIDVIVDGECEIHIAPNVDYPEEFFHIETVSGNSRPRGLIPAHMSGTEFSVKFYANHTQPLQLHGVTVYYETMGVL